LQTPASFEYERATSVEGALASLQKLGSGARVIAGGHSLLPMMKLRLAMPSVLIDIGRIPDLAGVRTLGRITGELLRMLGIDINFAPVMSIITRERSQLTNGLYSRSFGSSPGEVLGYTTVYMRGLQGTGCLGCLKHFPGIGAGAVDSHIEMPMVPLSRDDLLAQDLAPYIELFQRADDRVAGHA